MKKPDELKLIYVHKIGYNAQNEGLYQFIFSKDPETIDEEAWCWNMTPACDNALTPSEGYYDDIYELKTNKFDLFCLHEAVDRPYMHGFYNIHCLAYEDPDSERAPSESDFDDYENMFNGGYQESNTSDTETVLVFHYRMTLQDVEDLLYERDIVLKGKKFSSAENLTII